MPLKALIVCSKFLILMPVPEHVCAAMATFALSVFITASAFCIAIIYTWEQTDSIGLTFLAAIACTCVVRLVYVRYRAHNARQRQKKYTLPFIQYTGGTNL